MASSIQLVVLVLAYIQALQLSSCMGCKEEERQALLTFKQSLQDPGNRLSSWVGDHCCQWRGVGCDNGTGHIIELDLHNPYAFNIDESSPYNRRSLRGEIDPSLLQLKHLQYLDLSMNNFEGISVPEFISSLENLRHLNLSNAGFGGTIPHSLGNLTNLRVLSLFLHLDPRYFLLPELSIDNFQWLSHLRSLEHLDLRKVNLREADDWLHVMNTLPSLSELRLSSYLFGKVASLELLDLSSNEYINGELPVTLGSLCKLRSLDLSKNNISGDILEFIESSSGCIEDSLQLLDLSGNRLCGYLPNALGRFQNLKLVGLGSNLFTGPIPSSLGGLSSLQVLHLTGNKLSGNVPESLGQLSELVELRIASNMLQGSLSEAHFSNLTKLEFLFMSNNSLALNFRVGWVPPFQLKYIHLGSCQVGPLFPSWLRTQKGVVRLDMSNASISDHMPDWFWKSSPHISYLDLSDNQIKGKMPRSLKFKALSEIVLNSNLFEGPLPHFSSNVIYLDLSNNFFSGPIHPRVHKMLPRLQLLSLSSNLINGSIPLSLCKIYTLIALDLSKNQLSGQLPHCMWESSEFAALDFSNNNLSGVIPSSMGSLVSLESLHLGNNSLSGELPLSLQNCTELVTLDLGRNGFSGRIPPWIGESMSHLVILRLRSNMFSGGIPS
ncbi:putative leucine-rich repeat receptor-like protein kinase [Cinnamomum micranthum f. kanehirae]|uniref:Putative leucine-rich repeat receptor-like protein kinase n=1 Tax=Cinnamomum micranthum f. kanehirae TaxID=337451 RepID=A0A443PM71_9MAGN|nr:putative leucine-rich repeat receptor-like protein kinase [Cinnamomum micranthum f. kanehirae]